MHTRTCTCVQRVSPNSRASQALCPNAVRLQITKGSVKRDAGGRRELVALALCRRARHPPLGLGMGVVCPCLLRDRPYSGCSGGLAGVPAWCIRPQPTRLLQAQAMVILTASLFFKPALVFIMLIRHFQLGLAHNCKSNLKR